MNGDANANGDANMRVREWLSSGGGKYSERGDVDFPPPFFLCPMMGTNNACGKSKNKEKRENKRISYQQQHDYHHLPARRDKTHLGRSP